MMNYKNFETIYGNAVNIETTASLHLRKSPLSNLMCSYTEQIKKTVVEQFNREFPRFMAEAERHPEFEYAQFFGLLKKYPELLTETNKRYLIDLLDNIQFYNVTQLPGLDKIPTIEDFVK